ncbi:helix-turn-helix transcriptional regulator [Spirochaetes bacterium]|uniref:Helix-turn-helix transcriptional regulator n=1 Tax=Candidatus Scatousia excrementipullorum TaxID=2840936 RepID=A0A9D9DQK5_9BACT|nr:helix-turn-helix transcriptional regulator [Candidatus Scatousia excrementipullorum]
MSKCQAGRIVVMQDELLFKLGQSIRYLRLKKGMSQEELGFKSELSTNSVSAIERGAYNFKIKTLYKIASALQADVMDIINCKF